VDKIEASLVLSVLIANSLLMAAGVLCVLPPYSRNTS
jgi:hypothetical protein